MSTPMKATAPKRPPVPTWTLVVMTFLGVLCLILLVSIVAVSGSKIHVVKAAPAPVKTVTVTNTDTSNADAVQANYDDCKQSYHELLDLASKETTLFQKFASTTSEAFTAIGEGDVATVQEDDSTIIDLNGQITDLTDQASALDGSACQ